MSENTIDKLQLEISSDSNQATQSIDKLISALYSLNRSLSSAARSGLQSFQTSIYGAMESLRDFTELANRPIKLNIQTNSGDGISKMKYALERALGETKFDTSKIANQLSESFNITGKKAIQNVDNQLQAIVEQLVDSYNGENLKLSRGMINNLVNSISESAKIARSNLSGEFNGIEEEYERFYNYFKNKKIYISDFLKTDIGKSEFKSILESNLSNITRDAGRGIELNSVWEELSNKFPTIISPDTINAADQVLEVLQKINEARDRIKPVSVQTLFGSDYDTAIKNIQETSINAIKEAKENLTKKADTIFSDSGSKISLDIEINEDKIVSDIESAIRKASNIKYRPVDVELDVDTTKIKNKVTEKLKGLDIGNIPELASELTRISEAMIKLSGINLKDTGISAIINSISRLSKVLENVPKESADTMSGNIRKLADGLKSLAGVSIPDLTGAEKLVSAMRGIAKIGKIEIDSDRMTAGAVGITDVAQALRNLNGLTIPSLEGIDNLIISLRKLGGVNIGNAKDYLPQISHSLVSFIEELNRVGSLRFDFSGVFALVQNISRLGGAKATEAASNLKPLKDQLLKFISGLNGIESLKFDVTGLSDLVTSISRLGGKAAGNAVPNIQNLATALKDMMVTLSTAPKVSQNLIQMTQALSQLASNGNRVTNVSAGIASGFNRIGSSAPKTKKSIFSLASAFGKFYATYWLLIRGLGMFKKAIDISSDLTEVQNVVDVAFGDMKQKAEDLAATSIQDFGMSELTAKQISSRFQAMGMAMGFSQEKMSDMSIELTKLAADMASFYNVEQEAVAKSLQSVFSGETEPLRKFGLDLTNATLQSWALAQGLNVDVQKMSQMEKTALRYRYVMANTSAAQGDFAATADTWHNSLVRLSQSFQQVGGIVGGVLINAFKPFVSALNSVMQSVIKFAQTVANALGAIFGWTIEINSGGLATDFEAAGAGAEEMDKGTGGAAKNLKDMNKYIAAWHEVNNMTTDDDKAGGGGGGGGGDGTGDLGDAAEAQFKRTEGILDKYKSEIDSLYGLGEYIGDTLTKVMNDIDWDSIYQKARNFGTGLAQFLNGLISPQLFEATGKTIASALNTAIYAALSFGQEFDWKNFGESIAAGINGFFDTFDFESLAETLNVWAKGILDTTITALDKTKWDNIGSSIGTFLEKIDFLDIGKKVGQALWKAVNAGITTWKSMFDKAPIETTIITALSALSLSGIKIKGWEDILDIFAKLGNFKFVAIAGGISGVVLALDAFGYINIDWDKFADSIRKIGDVLAKFASGIWSGFISFLDSTAKIISPAIEPLVNGLASAIGILADVLMKIPESVISGLTQTFLSFFAAWYAYKGINTVISGISIAITGFKSAFETLGLAALAYGETGSILDSIAYVFGPSALGGVAFTAIAGGILAIATAIKTSVDNAAENSAIGQFSQAISDLNDQVSEKSEQIQRHLENTKSSLESAGWAESQMAKDLAKEYENLSGKSKLTADEQERMKEVSQRLVELVPDLSGYIDEQTGFLDVENNTLKDLIENMELYAKQQAAQEMLVDAYKQQYEATQNVKAAQDGYNKAVDEYLKDAGFAPGVIDDIKNATLDLTQAEIDFNNSPSAFQEKYGVKNLAELRSAYFGLSSEMSGYYDTLEEAKNIERDAGENIEFAKDMISESTNAIKENNDQIDEAKKNLPEYKQALSDVKSEFESISMTVSEGLAEKLAFEDSGIVESVVNTFDNLKNEVEVSSDELKSLFSAIAPGVSSQFIESLEQESPAMQAQVAMTLANMASGAQTSVEEIKSIFQTLGIELPNELIKNFKNQEPSMQMATINLLAKIDDGQKLTAENLMAVFNAFGLNIPTEIIESMENMEASVQQETITLLSQVAEGYDGSADELLQKFKDLGIALPDGLQEALEGKNEETKDQVIELLGQVLTAEESERGPLIERLHQLGVDLTNSGFAPGIRSGYDEASDASKGLSITAETSLSTEVDAAVERMNSIGLNFAQGFALGISSGNGIVASAAIAMVSAAEEATRTKGEVHSPSKLFARLGAYMVEGFNNGILGESDTTYRLMDDFVNNISDISFNIPKLDLSVPHPSFDFPSHDYGKFQSTIQMEMDAKMAALEFENRQLRESMEQNTRILEQILDKGIILDNNEFTKRFKSSATDFRRRTGGQLGVAF